MKAPSRRALPLLLAGLAIVALALPANALAHGIVGRADLPIPVWLFSWTAAIVLVVSFVALSTMWTRPQLQEQRLRRLFVLARPLEWLASVFGVGVFALVLYSGFAGAQVTQANFAVTFIYVLFWVGTPVASVLFGDVFHALSPWRTCGRALALLMRLLRRGRPSGSPLRYPEWLGMWPAVAGIVGFAWLELIYVERDRPATLAALSLGYFLVMLAGMALFGVEEWCSQADGFGVYFNLLSKLSAIVRREDGAVYLRRPLSGVTGLQLRAGTVAFICTQIGTTTFDGFSNGGIWRNNEPSLQSVFESLGFNPTPAQELTYSVGLIFCILVIATVYRVGIMGVHKVSRTTSRCFCGRARRWSIWPPTRSVTARTCLGPAASRSTTTSSPTPASGTCRLPRSSAATSAASRSRTTARSCSTRTPKRRCAASTGCWR
jgi:hypothetical protein